MFHSSGEMAHFLNKIGSEFERAISHIDFQTDFLRNKLSAKFLHAFMNFAHELLTPTGFRKLARCCCCEPRAYQMCYASTVLITLASNIKTSEISWSPKLHMLILLHHHNIITLKFWFFVVRCLRQTFTFCLLLCSSKLIFQQKTYT